MTETLFENPKTQHLRAIFLYGLMLGAVGLPIYLHAPKYFSDNHGVSLALVGFIMFVLRIFDFIQDPLFGRFLRKTRFSSRCISFVGAFSMCLGLLALFAVQNEMLITIAWFSGSLVLLFSGHSLLSIMIYAHSASSFDEEQQPKVAKYREGGQLLGICLSAVAPTVLDSLTAAAFTVYAVLLCVIIIWGTLAIQNNWKDAAQFGTINDRLALPDTKLRPMLLLGFTNAIPFAITSTLFLFFVEYVIGSSTASGPLLLLFFISAVASVPVWSALVTQFPLSDVLSISMLASILVFVFTFSLGQNDLVFFGVVCVITGALAGADITLLPVLYISVVRKVQVNSKEAFGYWSLVAKMALAMAVGITLPALDFAGFNPQNVTKHGLLSLSIAYCLVPVFMKAAAIVLLRKVVVDQFNDSQGSIR